MSDNYKCYRDFQTALDNQFTAFFKEYTREEENSIHIENFNPAHPCSNLIKTFFSDMLSLQIEEQSDSNCQLYFLPLLMLCLDIKKNKYAFWKLNYDFEGTAISDSDSLNKIITTIHDKKWKKQDIEKRIIDLGVKNGSKGGLFQKLFNKDVTTDELILQDMEITPEINNIYNSFKIKKDVIFKQITTVPTNSDSEAVVESEKCYDCISVSFPDETAPVFKFMTVIYFMNIDNNSCSLKCDDLYHAEDIKKSVINLIKKLFYIAVFTEKLVTSNKEHLEFGVAKEKEALFARIHEPLKSIIDTMRSANNTLMYVDRQINPPWQAFLNLSQAEKVIKVFDKSVSLPYDNGDTGKKLLYGIHDFERPFSSLTNKEKNDLKSFPDYFSSLVKENKGNGHRPLTKPNDTELLDILELIYWLLSESDEANYNILRFLKVITYDIKDTNKPVVFFQIVFYVLLGLKGSGKGGKGGEVSYFINNTICDLPSMQPNTIEGIKSLLTVPIWDSTAKNLSQIKNYSDTKSVIGEAPTVKLSGNISPGEFCGALAQLVSEELQGDEKRVKFESINIVCLGNGKHIGITIQCSGLFEDNSILRKTNDYQSMTLYHGMRDTFKTIENAVGSTRQFIDSVPKDLKNCYYPFAIFSDETNKKTTIRIVLGDIYSDHYSYMKNDFEKKKEVAF